MDEDEINIWYEDEKQKLLDQFTAKMENDPNHGKHETFFNQKMEKLHAKYLLLMQKSIARKKRSQDFSKKISAIANKLPWKKK